MPGVSFRPFSFYGGTGTIVSPSCRRLVLQKWLSLITAGDLVLIKKYRQYAVQKTYATIRDGYLYKKSKFVSKAHSSLLFLKLIYNCSNMGDYVS